MATVWTTHGQGERLPWFDEADADGRSVRHAIEVMGTVFSLDLRDPVDEAALEAVEADLMWVDATFSTYRPESDVSRLAMGAVRIEDCAPEVAEVLAQCDAAARETGGYFTATPYGRLDPSGLVKGWAVARCDRILRRAGSGRHAVNGGGDIQATGDRAPGEPWRLGIAHPLDPDRILAVVAGTDIAVATSGTAERGNHIVDPFTGRPATALASVTVVGPDVVRADIYATAAFAMGASARDWLRQLRGYDAMTVAASGEVWATTGFIACCEGGLRN